MELTRILKKRIRDRIQYKIFSIHYLHISHKHAPRRSVERRVREKVDMTRDEEAEQGHMGSRGMAQRHRRHPSSPSSAPAGSSARQQR